MQQALYHARQLGETVFRGFYKRHEDALHDALALLPVAAAVAGQVVALDAHVLLRAVAPLDGRADAAELLDRSAVAQALGLRQDELVGEQLVLHALAELAHAYVARDTLRVPLGEQNAEYTAPGVAHDVDLTLAEPCAEVFGHLARVLHKGIYVKVLAK